MNYSQSPEIARQYVKLSPDKFAEAHLRNYLAENGSSLKSYYDWLEMRVYSDKATEMFVKTYGKQPV